MTDSIIAGCKAALVPIEVTNTTVTYDTSSYPDLALSGQSVLKNCISNSTVSGGWELAGRSSHGSHQFEARELIEYLQGTTKTLSFISSPQDHKLIRRSSNKPALVSQLRRRTRSMKRSWTTQTTLPAMLAVIYLAMMAVIYLAMATATAVTQLKFQAPQFKRQSGRLQPQLLRR